MYNIYKFVHERNLLRFQRLIDEVTDEARRQQLLGLQTEERAKDGLPTRPQ